jgi:uncharacterized protein (DUF488 family)
LTKATSQSPIFAIGHSTRPIQEFVLILRAHSITTLVDIRTIPKSRHNPQFDGDALRASMAEDGIRYLQMKDLGGLRRPLKGSLTNAGWVNDSFRGFADYMQEERFRAALQKLIDVSRRTTKAGAPRVAIMCAEGNPFRCHRSLVADALQARGVRVVHISGPGKGPPHRMTPFAKVAGNRVTYPPSVVSLREPSEEIHNDRH